MNRFGLVAHVRLAGWLRFSAFSTLAFVVLTLLVPLAEIAETQDWPMRGGSATRNNTPNGKNIADDWEFGRYDRKTKKFASLRNIKWHAPLGHQAWGNPVVADGRIFVGSNNGAAHLKRFPANEDVSCLLCFRESDGKFLWQHSNMKLATGRVHDWPLQGICSTPVVEGKRLWYVSNRGEVVCLDTEAFNDNEDDGPVRNELVRIFRVRRYLDKTLARWYIHDRLRAAFKRADAELPSGALVRFDRKQLTPWTITKYDRANPSNRRRVPIFEIDRRGDQLVAYKLNAEDPPVRGKKLFEIGKDLFPGLAKTNSARVFERSSLGTVMNFLST